MQFTWWQLRLHLALALAALWLGGAQLHAAEMEEIVVKGDLGSLPGDNVETVFGFDKSLLEIPRSASTVSGEMMERFNMRDIDELIALAPGSFTQSFFGVAGVLDIRGTPGETYFRGVRRLDNPGNYPTPIGASDRVDVVRGPASPIYGPAKMGGYLNFNPRSARIEETGGFLDEWEGSLSVVAGSWGKTIIGGELGGPGSIGGRDIGYHLFGEVEDSGSYYDATNTRQTLMQASFDMDLGGASRLQWGGMWHDYDGNQVAGWNRVTQELIDDGIYVTGSPRPADQDGDGRITHQEYFGADVFQSLEQILVPGAPFDREALERVLQEGKTDKSKRVPQMVGTLGMDLAGLELALRDPEKPDEAVDLAPMALVNPGLGRISGHQVLVSPEDTQENKVLTLYLDYLGYGGGWEWKNQLFFESYDHLTENVYGFSHVMDSWVLEEKLVVGRDFQGPGWAVAMQLSPSIRHTNFTRGDDFINEHFDRRDLTQESTALDKRIPSTELDYDYSEYYRGEYTDLGFAALADFTTDAGFGVLAGVRYDSIRVKSHQPQGKLLFTNEDEIRANDTLEGVSWTLSLNYDTPVGLVPYITASKQATMIVGQGAEAPVSDILDGQIFDDSELLEAGLKASLLDNSLYFALSVYKQERTDPASQATVTNQSSETEGIEFEARWVVNEQLLLTFGYSHIEVINLNTLQDGARFSFVGCADLPDIPCHLLYAGTLAGDVSSQPSGGRRAGIPEDIFSLTGTYDFGNGWTVNGSVIDVDSTPSGYSHQVTLPAYRLLNLGFAYEADKWLLSVSGKNLTDERYFRANFPNLFGSVVVLPELPRHYQARLRYSL